MLRIKGGPFTRISETKLKEGSVNRTSFCMCTLWREAEGGLHYWEPLSLYTKLWWQASSSIRAPWGTSKRAHLPGTLRDGCLLPQWPRWGTWLGGPSNGNFENLLREGTGYGASLSTHQCGCSFVGDPEGYERKVLGMGIALHGVSVGQSGVISSTRDFDWWLKGALEVQLLTVCGSSVKWTRRDSSLAEDPEGYVEKALETGISFHSGPIGEPVTGINYWGLWDDERGSSDDATHSEEAQRDSLLYWGLWKML